MRNDVVLGFYTNKFLYMNENINLYEILKGHEGETFYSPVFGIVILKEIKNDYLYLKSVDKVINLYKDGRYNIHGECMLFPSKVQRDWNKWIEEQKPKVPKTWSDIKHCNVEVWQHISHMDYGPTEPIVKSALALLKVHQLIEVGYGGDVTFEDWKTGTTWSIIPSDEINNRFEIVLNSFISVGPIFHTMGQAEEFLKYPENVQLLKDYFMI